MQCNDEGQALRFASPSSSYRAHVGQGIAPDWFDTDGLHGHVLRQPVLIAADGLRGARRYADLVATSTKIPLWEHALR